MKSIRQKAKAYDKALEIAKSKLHYNDKPCFVDVTELFSELKESEDERIRKAVIDYFDDANKACENPLQSYGIHTDNVIAWLEKQGQKPATIDVDKMVRDYANNKERGNEEFGKPVNCMIRAYKQGLNDAIGKVVLNSWNEDDEKNLQMALYFANYYNRTHIENSIEAKECINWLKSLKQRME